MQVIYLYLAVSISTAVIAHTGLCPNKCTCKENSHFTSLTVANCTGHSEKDIDQLTEQLNTLLSRYLTCGSLTSLNIVNTPLTHVPRSVCRLTTLTRLHVHTNQLTRLPDNCITNLTDLEELNASKNNITELQDGLFDGLSKLADLRLYINHISSIGLKVFNSSSTLTSLQYVNLKENRLTELEPWPYFVGLNRKPHQRTTVILDGNQISNFTNNMGLVVKCGMKVMGVYLSLNGNNINHISDLLKGWNISLLTLWCLAPFERGRSSSAISFSFNYLQCDCADFDIYKIANLNHKSTMLDDAFCRTPDYLHYTRVNSIPLIELVCELTERCPPGCRCAHRPANTTLHVNCSNSNLTALPLELPALPKSYTKYKLDLSKNRLLRRLEHRDYFVNTSILDVSNCAIETVDSWKQLLTVKHVYLHGNRLASLPRSIVKLNVSTEQLSLHNNPWRCGCDDRWMSNWLNSIDHVLIAPSNVLCSYPHRLVSRNILHISGDEFCIDPVAKALMIGMSSFAGVAVIFIFAGFAVYLLRVSLFTRWKFHPFDRDECLGEDMNYDVFLCCSSDDHDPHAVYILDLLESSGFRVCYHERDFRAGELITNNMSQSITRSKRTLCLLSANFLNSPYCMTEFDMAFHHIVAVKRKKRLIVLMTLNNGQLRNLRDNDASDTVSLRQYLRQYTYIDYSADDWLDKLLYALPLRGLLQPQRDDNDDVQLIREIQVMEAATGDDVPLIN